MEIMGIISVDLYLVSLSYSSSDDIPDNIGKKLIDMFLPDF